MKLPLLLAGPILRRVEPSLVSVWIAVSKPGAVRVDVFQGVVDAGTSAGLFDADRWLARGEVQPTLRAGANLHIAVAYVQPPTPLVPGQIYSYNVTLLGEDGISDLKSLELLVEKDFELEVEGADKIEHRQLPIGYDPGALPTFSLPPLSLDDLVLLHGSCRRAFAEGQDALAYVDDLIAAKRGVAAERPHLLVMTGDQIYADDVAAWMLELVNEIGRAVVEEPGVPEEFPLGPPGEPPSMWVKADLEHFPSRKRSRICLDWAGISSQDVISHVLSYGEFCGMYLSHWSNRLWHRRLPEIPPNLDPTKVLESVNVTEQPLRDELLRMKRFFDPAPLADDDANPLDYLVDRSDREAEAPSVKKRRQEQRDFFRGYLRHIERLRDFYSTLPKVQRALANVPSLMMFDDHEVTDDWNITHVWVEKVLARAAGKALLRNGLVAYAFFQAWGNDPLAFGEQPVLAIAQGAKIGKESFGADACARLDEQFGLDGGVSKVPWHFRYRGPSWELLSLDTRTRRAFPSPYSPPRLISAPALAEQVPDGPLESGLEALFVLSPVPVVGPSLMDELLQPGLLRWLTFKGAAKDPNKYLERDPESWAMDPVGMEEMLARLEARAAGRPVLFLSGDVHYSMTAYLDYFRGARRTRFIQLTSSAFKNVNSLAPLASFQTAQRALTGALRPARLGWTDSHPQPFALPPGSKLPSVHLRRINRNPLLLPTTGWPPGTEVTRDPDWAWRYEHVVDTRPDPGQATSGEIRPDTAQPPFPEQDLPEQPSLEQLSEVARFHGELTAKLAARRVVFPSTLGVVRFVQVQSGPAVRHELVHLPLGAPPGKVADAYTVHVVALQVPEDQGPPKLGAGDG